MQEFKRGTKMEHFFAAFAGIAIGLVVIQIVIWAPKAWGKFLANQRQAAINEAMGQFSAQPPPSPETALILVRFPDEPSCSEESVRIQEAQKLIATSSMVFDLSSEVSGRFQGVPGKITFDVPTIIAIFERSKGVQK